MSDNSSDNLIAYQNAIDKISSEIYDNLKNHHDWESVESEIKDAMLNKIREEKKQHYYEELKNNTVLLSEITQEVRNIIINEIKEEQEQKIREELTPNIYKKLHFELHKVIHSEQKELIETEIKNREKPLITLKKNRPNDSIISGDNDELAIIFNKNLMPIKTQQKLSLDKLDQILKILSSLQKDSSSTPNISKEDDNEAQANLLRLLINTLENISVYDHSSLFANYLIEKIKKNECDFLIPEDHLKNFFYDSVNEAYWFNIYQNMKDDSKNTILISFIDAEENNLRKILKDDELSYYLAEMCKKIIIQEAMNKLSNLDIKDSTNFEIPKGLKKNYFLENFKKYNSLIDSFKIMPENVLRSCIEEYLKGNQW